MSESGCTLRVKQKGRTVKATLGIVAKQYTSRFSTPPKEDKEDKKDNGKATENTTYDGPNGSAAGWRTQSTFRGI